MLSRLVHAETSPKTNDRVLEFTEQLTLDVHETQCYVLLASMLLDGSWVTWQNIYGAVLNTTTWESDVELFCFL